jgi:hypothetical protein
VHCSNAVHAKAVSLEDVPTVTCAWSVT